MDGSARKIIISVDLGFPNGLALDYEAKRLYWTDALKDKIETADLHGGNRVQLVLDATHPFGLTQVRGLDFLSFNIKFYYFEMFFLVWRVYLLD